MLHIFDRHMPFHIVRNLSLVLLAICTAMGIYSCANIVMPRGGPVDETPPEIVSISPSDSNKNIKPKKIEVRTSKYMEVKDLDKYLTFSPVIDVKPTVISYGKRIEIKLVDSLLKPNTTYKLSLGNALVDNRESTPIKDFSYVFSTGAAFDSLQITGKIISVLTGKPDTMASVLLYELDVPDSAITTVKPTYYAKVDRNGQFIIDLLPNKPYKIIAITDEDQNMLYTPAKESIAFLDTFVVPQMKYEQPLVLLTFLEKDTAKDAITTTTPRAEKLDRFANNKPKDSKNAPAYTVAVDTTVKERTFDVTDTLRIELNTPLTIQDERKVYLSYAKDNVEAEAITKIIQDSTSIKIVSQWQEGLVYTLRLVKGWAKDTADAEVVPGKYSFKTKSKEDYATLRINFDSTYMNSIYYAVVIDKENPTDTLLHQKVTLSQYEIKYMNPGEYLLYLYEDTNLDGQWTTGSYAERLQPEKILNNKTPIVLRKGWENEIDFIYIDVTSNSRDNKNLKKL